MSTIKKTKIVKRKTVGFGVPIASDPHYFKMIIPSRTGSVILTEVLGGDEVIERVVISREKWNLIKNAVQSTLNTRLKNNNLDTCKFKNGVNEIDRLLGKEVCVLAWSIESMDISSINAALRKWIVLKPEELWWLFSVAAKDAGKSTDRHIGWRGALKQAFSETD